MSSSGLRSLKETFANDVPGTDYQMRTKYRDLMLRNIPFVRSPFKHPAVEAEGCGGSHTTIPLGDVENNGRPPFWFDLSVDLAWCAAFASLTNNSTITGAAGVANYAVFFSLVWHLWASQATYNIKFYTDDWLHRICLILQLITYGGLSPFTADLDVFWWLNDYTDEVFIGDVSSLTAAALFNEEVRKKRSSLMGATGILFINRALLLFQYICIEFHRIMCRRREWHCQFCNGCTNCRHCRHCEHPPRWGPTGHWAECNRCSPTSRCSRCWRCSAVPVSIALSTLIFLGCFLMLRFGEITRSWSIIQFTLWITAILIEVLGHGLAGQVDESSIYQERVTERLGTLTVIVMGEGINGICAVSNTTVNAVGMGLKMVIVLTCLGVTLCCIWLCYFHKRPPQISYGRPVWQLWFLLHLPFHLSLILFLDGLKNLLLQSSLAMSIGYLRSIFKPTGISDSTAASVSLGRLGMSFVQYLVDSQMATEAGKDAQKTWYQRLVLSVIYKQFEAFNKIDGETEFMFEQYQSRDDQVLSDLAVVDSAGDWGPIFQSILARLEKPTYEAIAFTLPTAGAVILLIGILNYLQGKPQDRYDWGTVLNRVVGGCLLIILASVNIRNSLGENHEAVVWRLPIVAAILLVITVVDLSLTRLSLRSLRSRMDTLMLIPLDEDAEGKSLISQG